MNNNNWNTGKPDSNRVVEVTLTDGTILDAWILSTGNWSQDFVMVWREKEDMSRFDIDALFNNLDKLEEQFRSIKKK